MGYLGYTLLNVASFVIVLVIVGLFFHRPPTNRPAPISGPSWEDAPKKEMLLIFGANIALLPVIWCLLELREPWASLAGWVIIFMFIADIAFVVWLYKL